MWLPLYFKEVLHYDKAAAGINYVLELDFSLLEFFCVSGLISMAYDIGGIIGGPVVGILIDRFFSGSALTGLFWLNLLGKKKCLCCEKIWRDL